MSVAAEEFRKHVDLLLKLADSIAVGLLIYTRSKKTHIWLFGVGVTLLLVAVGFLPISGYYPPVFGVGGGLVMALFLITINNMVLDKKTSIA